MVTVAFGMLAPLLSRTVPAMMPLSTCAQAGTIRQQKEQKKEMGSILIDTIDLEKSNISNLLLQDLFFVLFVLVLISVRAAARIR
jgi:hypothetical protein